MEETGMRPLKPGGTGHTPRAGRRAVGGCFASRSCRTARRRTGPKATRPPTRAATAPRSGDWPVRACGGRVAAGRAAGTPCTAGTILMLHEPALYQHIIIFRDGQHSAPGAKLRPGRCRRKEFGRGTERPPAELLLPSARAGDYFPGGGTVTAGGGGRSGSVLLAGSEPTAGGGSIMALAAAGEDGGGGRSTGAGPEAFTIGGGGGSITFEPLNVAGGSVLLP